MNLTDKAFWLNYWESKDNLIFNIEDNYLLIDILTNIILKQNEDNPKISTSLEMGGFPGYYSIYLNKKFRLNSTLVDFVIHPSIIENLAATNGINRMDIHTIESDIFEEFTTEKYDLVFSNGLIEHFQDTKKILSQHVHFLNEGGTLFISLPNFQGFNGWIQKTFDVSNYKKHYIECMDLKLLHAISTELNLKEVKAEYYGVFSIWLENYSEKNNVFKTLFKLIWFLGKVVSKILPFKSKLFSPFIVLICKK